MDIQSIIEPSLPQHEPSLSQQGSLPEKKSIPCVIDYASGSSQKAIQRHHNAQASQRFRKRKREEKHLMRLPENGLGNPINLLIAYFH